MLLFCLGKKIGQTIDRASDNSVMQLRCLILLKFEYNRYERCQDVVVQIDDDAKDGGPEMAWHLCSFYQDILLS